MDLFIQSSKIGQPIFRNANIGSKKLREVSVCLYNSEGWGCN